LDVKEVWERLADHLADRYGQAEGTHRATTILTRFYL